MDKRKLLFLLFLVVLLKMAFFLNVVQRPQLAVSFADPLEYFNLAKGLVYDHVYTSSTRPILFPAIYALYVLVFGNTAPIALVFTQYILSVVIGCTIYQIIFLLTGDQRKGILGFCFYALNPVITLYESSTFSETVAIFFVAAGCLYYLKRRFVLTGLLFGLSTLVRPSALALAWIPLLFLLFDPKLASARGRIRAFVSMLLAVAVVVFPWSARNYLTYDRFFVSNISEFSFGLYQIHFVYADVKKIDIVKAREQWLTHVFDTGEFEKKYDRPDLSKFKRMTAYWEYQQRPDITAVAFREAVKVYLAHPYPVGKVIVTGMALAFSNPALWPMSEFWGYHIDHGKRSILFDKMLGLKLQDISAADLSPFLNPPIGFSAVYGLINVVLLVLIARNVLKGQVNAVMLLMFLLSWFIAGFAGIGGSRYFIGGYVFFIVAALAPTARRPGPAGKLKRGDEISTPPHRLI